jgi:hypothetical protein
MRDPLLARNNATLSNSTMSVFILQFLSDNKRSASGQAMRPHRGGRGAPVAAGQTRGTVSPKRSFVGAAVNGWVGWQGDRPL